MGNAEHQWYSMFCRIASQVVLFAQSFRLHWGHSTRLARIHVIALLDTDNRRLRHALPPIDQQPPVPRARRSTSPKAIVATTVLNTEASQKPDAPMASG